MPLLKGRWLVIAAAIAAVVIAVIVTQSGGDDDKGSATKPDKDAIKVSFVYSPEKEKLLEPLIEDFNRKREKSGGKPVFVEGEVVSSGESESKIATEKLKPVAWSPASSLWGRLLNFQADAQYAPRESPSIVRTPLVIAVWEPFARALGYPKKKTVSFDQVLELATDAKGWGAIGKPQFGKFKLGHTNPDFSTSGLSAVAAEYYATTGKREGLTVEDIEDPKVRQQVKDVEQSIVHYGDTTLFFADQMKRYGPGYASAVAMEEVTVIDFNRTRGSQTKLVSMYPEEGTFFSDNPFIVLNAPWVSAQEKAAAEVFQRYLAKQITPAEASKEGFRPGDAAEKPAGGRVNERNGADPSEPKRTLSLPEPRVLDRIKSAWREDRKPANVQLVVDVSGSMSEEGKLDQAKQGLKEFFKQIGKQDNVGLIAFNDQIVVDEPLGRFGENRAKLQQAVDDLFPDGETAVYGATDAGWTRIRDLKDEDGINAVVVLTDGEDTSSRVPPDALARAFRDQSKPESPLPIRVYTIAYGSQANKEVLKDIAEASGGKPFEGDPDDIESVYRSISSFF